MNRPSGLIAVASAFAALALLLAPGVASAASTTGDFNGDFFSDLAVGVPGEDIGAVADAGAVNVLYGGSANGLGASGDQVWHQDVAGIGEQVGSSDQFGYAVATGDFNGDQFSDLAVGVPSEVGGTGTPIGSAGAVHVIYGSASGLTSAGSQVWHQDVSGIMDAAEAGDQFGQTVAAGDLNGDGADDLAVGVPSEDIVPGPDAGAVSVIYSGGPGSPLGAAGDQFWHQDVPGVGETVEQGDAFGYALVAADFDGLGTEDLAIGVPQDNVGNIGAGVVNVLPGGPGGLATAGSQLWHQDVAGIGESTDGDDHFGSALAAGDFDADGADDLAVGVPQEEVILGGDDGAGCVHAIYGVAGSGLSAADDQVWHQDIAGIAEQAEFNDAFGTSLTAADFDASGGDDLAIGAYGETVGGVQSGVAQVLYSDNTGLLASGDQIWHQDIAGILDQVETNDQFGWSLTAGDFDGSASFDLAIGAPGEDIAGAFSGGAAVLYSRRTFLVDDLGATDNQLWHQNSAGIGETAETNDVFGHALASGAGLSLM